MHVPGGHGYLLGINECSYKYWKCFVLMTRIVVSVIDVMLDI